MLGPLYCHVIVCNVGLKNLSIYVVYPASTCQHKVLYARRSRFCLLSVLKLRDNIWTDMQGVSLLGGGCRLTLKLNWITSYDKCMDGSIDRRMDGWTNLFFKNCMDIYHVYSA